MPKNSFTVNLKLIRFVFHIIDILCLVYTSLSATADCLASNYASWVQLDAKQSSDRAKEKHEIRIEAIVLLDSDWLLSLNNMETVPKDNHCNNELVYPGKQAAFVCFLSFTYTCRFIL